MRIFRIALPLLAAGLLMSACASAEQPSPLSVPAEDDESSAPAGAGPNDRDEGTEKEKPTDAGHDFEVETFDGNTFVMSEHRGMPLVLNFWESW